MPHIPTDKRIVESLGPKLLFASGDEAVGTSGKSAFSLQSTNEDNCRFSIGHSETGLSAIHSEGTLQIESGSKQGPGGEHSMVIIANSGGIAVQSQSGALNVTAETICLEADVEIILQAPSIRLGYSEDNATQDVTINGRNVDANAKGGNIGDTLGTSNLMSIFAGGALGGLAAAAAGIAGAAGGAAGQAGLGENGQGDRGGFASGATAIPSNITTLSQTLTSGQSNQTLMADGSTTTNYIGVGIGSTPTSSDVGNDGDIWYTLC